MLTKNQLLKNLNPKKLTCKIVFFFFLHFNNILYLYRLFGTEDVDLRTQLNIPALVPPPPPPLISTDTELKNWKGDMPIRSSFDQVRAKLAEAARANHNKSSKGKTHRNDIDLRPKLLPVDDSVNEIEEKYNMIVNRAQQQLDNDDISLEQYNSVIKQVMQIQAQNNRKRKSDSMSSSKISLTPISDDENGFSSSSTEIDRQGRQQRQRKRDRKSSESSDHNENNSSASKTDVPAKSKIFFFLFLKIN